MRAGVVLAGGRSTRFGNADKAVAELAGTPMIRRVVDRVVTIVDELVVNCRDDQIDDIDAVLDGVPAAVTFAPDPEPDRGPLAGIGTGLQATDAEYAAVVACDMPFVKPALLDHLFERAAGHDAAVPRLSDGWFQTTQAVYRTAAMAAACERALDRGDRRIVAAFDALDVAEVDEAEVRRITSIKTFDNVNTRAEFDEATARLAEQ